MKHKIKWIKSEEDEVTAEKFCESVGFDNVIGIYPGDTDYVMIHYKSEN